MGDPAGIGPEVVAKAIAQEPDLATVCRLVVAGPAPVVRDAIAAYAPSSKVEIETVTMPDGWSTPPLGIASAEVLNAFPPDPKFPQTPERISPHVKSVVVIAKHIPVGAFRCKTNVPVQYLDMLVLRRMDRIAYRLAEALEFPTRRGKW